MNFFTPELTSILTITLLAVTAILLAYLAKPVFELIKANTNTAVFAFLKERAKTYVATLASDPAWKELEGGEKKERAMLWLLEFAKQHNIPLDAEFAGKIVEEAYVGLKRVLNSISEVITT